jgi:hypothetical protein
MMKSRLMVIQAMLLLFALGSMISIPTQSIQSISFDPVIRASTPSDSDLPTHVPMAADIFVVPAITNDHILPDSILGATSNNITLTCSPDEYLSASFVVHALDSIAGMTAIISDLTGPTTIDKSAIDLRVVKIWYQAGVSINDTSHKHLTPELLLKDDSLVQTQGTDNYVKYTDGTLHLISGVTQPEGNMPTTAQMPIQDAATLQPVDIASGTNKQFWITLHIPGNAVAGDYAGTITLSDNAGVVNLNLTVLPIDLLAPELTYSMYYSGILDSAWSNGSISSFNKRPTQLKAELNDLVDHGVTNPTCYQPFDQTLLGGVLTLRDSLGMTNKPLYYLGLKPWGYQPVAQVEAVIALARSYGVPDVYFYGDDEAYGSALTNQRTSWTNIRNAGGKMFVAGNTASQGYPGNFPAMGDIQDLEISYESPPTTMEAAKWHSIGHQIFSYGNPQCGEELPETYRRNYGLVLWQGDYDGAMDFAYQWGFGNIWNDFDSSTYRDHVMAYPTIDGVIDTVQWEGFREGINDVRYLTTLKTDISHAKAKGVDTSDAEEYLVELKSDDLSTLDLDSVRSTIINYILSLQPRLDHILVSPTNPSVWVDGSQTFQAEGYDSNNDPIEGLAFAWSVTNNMAGSINPSGLFTAGTTAGNYPNVIQATSGHVLGTASVTVTLNPNPNTSTSVPATTAITQAGGINMWFFIITGLLVVGIVFGVLAMKRHLL